VRILFSSLPTHGHTYPLLPLALAARDQGHDITFATGEGFHEPLNRLGFDVVAAGVDMRQAFGAAAVELGVAPGRMDLPQDEVIVLAGKAFGSIMPRSFANDLRPVIDQVKPDLVVHELANPGAGLAALVADVPALCHGFGRVSPEEFHAVVGGELAAVAAELGTDLPDGNPFLLGNPYLDICPPTFQSPISSAPPTGSRCARCRSPSRASCPRGCVSTSERWCT